MQIKCIVFDFYNVLYPFTKEAKEVVEECKKKDLELAAISSLSPSKVKEIADYYGIENILPCWKLGLHKTRPEIYLRLLTQVELKGPECLMLDDQQERLAAAKQAGLKTVWFKLKEQEKFPTTDHVIEDIQELLEIL